MCCLSSLFLNQAVRDRAGYSHGASGQFPTPLFFGDLCLSSHIVIFRCCLCCGKFLRMCISPDNLLVIFCYSCACLGASNRTFRLGWIIGTGRQGSSSYSLIFVLRNPLSFLSSFSQQRRIDGAGHVGGIIAGVLFYIFRIRTGRLQTQAPKQI